MLAGYLPATTARGPACPPRARRACWACVGGPWHLVQRIPASVAPLVRSPGVSAPPCPVVRRTPYLGAATESQHTPYARAERARVDRTAYNPHPRTRGFHIEERRSRASDPCTPACASQCVVAPHRHPRTPGMTGMSATCRSGGAGVAARFVAIARDRGDAAWASFCTSSYDPGFIPPLKDTSSTRPRAAGLALWCRRVVRAPVGDAAAPFRRGTGSVDATCASCRSPIGSAGSCHCHGLRRIHRHLCSLCSSCVPVRGGPAPARDGQTRQYHRPAAPGRRVAFRADRRR